ncbi:MAG: type II toxin-antitoxin system RelE/ParE family toxin [Candidatus Omnitrophota bacterium]
MYNIEISPSALKFITHLTRKHKGIADRIIYSMDRLKDNPLLGKKLLGELKDFRSLRVGDYRVIYSIIARKVLIQIVNIGHRREIYS